MAACVGMRRDSIGLVCLGVWLAAISGCKEKETGFKFITLEGKIESVERSSEHTGKISVMYFSEKQGQDILGHALVTKETEIIINGVISTLKDLREGDRVRGEVRIEKQGKARVQTAIKITVDRPKPVGG